MHDRHPAAGLETFQRKGTGAAALPYRPLKKIEVRTRGCTLHGPLVIERSFWYQTVSATRS